MGWESNLLKLGRFLEITTRDGETRNQTVNVNTNKERRSYA